MLCCIYFLQKKRIRSRFRCDRCLTILNGTSLDTFTLLTYSIEEDTVISDNPANVVLGSYVDPTFGAYSASFYTQLRLAFGVDPNFTDPSEIVIDSFVLAFWNM